MGGVLRGGGLALLVIFSVFSCVSIDFMGLVRPGFTARMLTGDTCVSVLSKNFTLKTVSSFLLIREMLGQ